MFASWVRKLSFWTSSRSARRRARRRPPAVRHRWRFDLLEDRLAPATFMGGVSVATGDVNGDGILDLVTGAGQGGSPHVKVYDGTTGNLLSSFFAYDPSFTGGVNVAVADINDDGAADIITAPGPGMQPLIKIFSGRDGSLLGSFLAYDAKFLGGVNVAAGDLEGNGRPDIVTGPESHGLSNVKAFRADGSLFKSFFAYDSGFFGGVSVAVGDIQGTGRADIITGAGSGGGSHVKVYDPTTAATAIEQFMAYDPGFTGGVHVGAGDFFGDGHVEVYTGAGSGGGPHVKVFNGAAQAVGSFMAYGTDFRGGVNVAGFGPGLMATGPGAGGGPHVKTFQSDGTTPTSFFAYEPASAPSGTIGRPVGNLIQPVFDLDPASDTGPKGDQRTALNVVTLTGTTSPNATVTLAPNGLTATADSTGHFSFSGVPLNPGANTFTASATNGFNTVSFTQTITLDSAPVVSTPIGAISDTAGTPNHTIDLSNFITDVDVVGTQLRLNTSAGPVDIQLLDQKAPLTVQNFLNYVNSGRYNSSIFHRLATNFVLQGGGFVFNANPSSVTAIQTDPAVHNEFGMSNVRGTLAMAKLGSDPNSATSQFFFNLADNSSNLDNQNGGFTVFAQVINNTMNVVDQLSTPSSSLMVKDESSANSAFNTLPLVNYNGRNFPSDTTRSNFELINNVTFLRHSDLLTFSVVSNTNPGLVNPAVIGNQLTLNYTTGQTGSSTITVRATDQDGLTVDATFTVTVHS